MSMIKRFIDYQEYHEALLCALKYLEEKDLLPRDEVRGITRKIIGGQRPDDLNTKSQRWTFYNRIEPLLKQIRCEGGGCNSQIGINGLQEAFDNKRQYGALLCIDCLINKWRHEHYSD